MDYLQYKIARARTNSKNGGFKPYYKWITFNIRTLLKMPFRDPEVLNLIINGLPSILKLKDLFSH